MQAKYISHDMPMAPASRLGDGLMDLFFVKKGAGRIAMIKVRRGSMYSVMRQISRYQFIPFELHALYEDSTLGIVLGVGKVKQTCMCCTQPPTCIRLLVRRN